MEREAIADILDQKHQELFDWLDKEYYKHHLY